MPCHLTILDFGFWILDWGAWPKGGLWGGYVSVLQRVSGSGGTGEPDADRLSWHKSKIQNLKS
jgi:hypothetical protein